MDQGRNRLSLLYSGYGLDVNVPWWICKRLGYQRSYDKGSPERFQIVQQVRGTVSAKLSADGVSHSRDDLIALEELDVTSTFCLYRAMMVLSYSLNGEGDPDADWNPEHVCDWVPDDDGYTRKRFWHCVQFVYQKCRVHLSHVLGSVVSAFASNTGVPPEGWLEEPGEPVTVVHRLAGEPLAPGVHRVKVTDVKVTDGKVVVDMERFRPAVDFSGFGEEDEAPAEPRRVRPRGMRDPIQRGPEEEGPF